MIKYHVGKGAKVLFIGINPHFGSFSRGVPFSNNKTFWYLLSRSGLIKESIDDLRDDRKLKEIYSKKFSRVYGLSLLNLIDRPSKDVSYLKGGEEITGRNRIIKTIRKKKPKIVCFIGKITFQKFSGEKEVKFGWQPQIKDFKAFVAHFPVRGGAAIRLKELRVLRRYL